MKIIAAYAAVAFIAIYAGVTLALSGVGALGWTLAIVGTLYFLILLGAGKLYAIPEGMALASILTLFVLPLLAAETLLLLNAGIWAAVITAVGIGLGLILLATRWIDSLPAKK